MTRPLAVVSPHLDDAVLGCGQLLAHRPGALVVTVFAGRPPPRGALTPWDAAAGFSAGADVVGVRRGEDRQALHALNARPVWLTLLDAQYGPPPDALAAARALECALVGTGADTVAIPLGLFHQDHERAHAAALTVLSRHPELRWLAYEDAIYRRIPGLVDARVSALRAAGLGVERARLPLGGRAARKARAVAAYASQLRALDNRGGPGAADALAGERYWTLRP